MAQRTIAVVGSLNIDFITRTERIPNPGETLAARSFETGFGGKGANQAVACARLATSDVSVHMIGNVGEDVFGHDYLKGLEKEGIVNDGVKIVKGEKTGVSNILVDESTGENRILFTANANNALSHKPKSTWDLIPDVVDLVVFQLEVPIQIVLHNMCSARKRGKHVVFNPAPAQVLPESAYRDIDTLIMNETESKILSGATSGSDEIPPADLARVFIGRGVRDAVIITLGANGLAFATASGQTGKLDARRARVVDTTAAGDTFVGAYAVRRAQHTGTSFDYHSALAFATAAASKSVEKPGAMAAIPYLREVEWTA